MTESDRRISDRLVGLVQIIFAFVMAQGLSLNRDILLSPGHHVVPLIALIAIYVTTILSWIDWHMLMERRPYNMSARNSLRWAEVGRLWFDLIIVVSYAYLLFLIPSLSANESGSLRNFLITYVVLFALYTISGQLRRYAYGPWASQLRPNVVYGSYFLVLWLIYEGILYWAEPLNHRDARWLNIGMLLASILLMLLYRWRRRLYASRIHKTREEGRIVGIDIDGVLANQIDEILRRVQRRYGIELSYQDVTDWRLPIADTDIAAIIVEAMNDPEYILSMKVHSGVSACVRELYQSGRLFVVTGRPTSAEGPTRQWLDDQRIPFDGIVYAQEAKKHIYSFDVLIDDYIGNVQAFLSSSNGAAILMDQPWNRDRSEIAQYISEGRLGIAECLEQVPDLVKTVNLGPSNVAHA